MKTRFLTLFAALICVAQVSAYDFKVDGIYYNILGGDSVEVTSYVILGSYSGSVIIPDKVTYNSSTYRVTSIGEDAFYYCSNLTEVTIPNGVTTIGSSAFSRCSSLAEITIPNSVTTIGSSAFSGCSSLTTITWNVKNCSDFSYDNAPFSYINSQITNFTFGNNVEHIPAYLCYNMSNLTSVTIPNNVTSIGWGAFYSCSDLTSVTIGEGVTSIGMYAFADCTALKSIVIPNSVTSIEELAFSGTGLTSVTIGKNVTALEYAFSGCSNLESIKVDSRNTKYHNSGNCIIETDTKTVIAGFKASVIPNDGSVTIIGRNAFESSGLKSIVIPNTITSIEQGAFQYCYGLTSITLSEGLTSIKQNTFSFCDSLTSITIPNSVTSIDSYAFQYCRGLTSITLGSGITSIGGSAFESCDNLTKINYAGDIANWCAISFSYGWQPTSASYNLYINDIEIKDLIIPDNVTSISDYAFYGFSGLTSVSIGKSVTSIGYAAFGSCDNLTKINYTGDIANWCAISFSYGWRPTSASYNLYINDIEIKDLIIPDNVTSISDYAFYDFSGLTSVSIGKSVTYIGKSAFSNCSGLTSLTIGKNVISIGDNAFYNCSGLTTVTIPNSVDSIGNSAFYDCSGLTSLTIGENVISIGDYAFYNCKGLTAVTIPNSVTTIGNSAFYNCSGLTAITIPNSVTSIGGSAFRNCSRLTSITIGESVNWMGLRALDGCNRLSSVVWNARNFPDCEKTTPFVDNWTSDRWDFDLRSQITEFIFGDSVEYIPAELCSGMQNLTSVTIGENITSIGKKAFYNCKGLTNLSINAMPPSVQSNTFTNVSTEVQIIVPCGTADDYQEADGWSNFSNYQEDMLFDFTIETANNIQGIVSVTQEPTCENDAVAIIEAITNEGYNFVEWSDGNTENPRTLDVTKDIALTAIFEEIITIENIQLRTDHIALFPDESYFLNVVIYPKEAVVSQLTWTSSDEEVATVDETGFVTAHAVGTVTITVSADGLYDECFVTVVNTDINSEVIVETTNNSALFTWATIAEAFKYQFSIYADEARTDLICKLTCNAWGQLIGVSFPHKKAAAEQPTSGTLLQFVVDGLASGTTYSFTLNGYTETEEEVLSKAGQFTTTGSPATGVETPYIASPDRVNKVLENGTIYILRNGEKYTVDGRKVE